MNPCFLLLLLWTPLPNHPSIHPSIHACVQYSDFDTAPNEFDEHTIARSDDGFFVVEQYSLLSQYFMAVSPKHPIMYYAVQRSLINLLQASDTLNMGAAVKTGPHALHKALQDFQWDVGILVDPMMAGAKPVKAGLYHGSQNRSIRVVGSSKNENEYVHRLAMKPAERWRGYRQMNMKHFSEYTGAKAKKSGMSCMAAILNGTISDGRGLLSTS